MPGQMFDLRSAKAVVNVHGSLVEVIASATVAARRVNPGVRAGRC